MAVSGWVMTIWKMFSKPLKLAQKFISINEMDDQQHQKGLALKQNEILPLLRDFFVQKRVRLITALVLFLLIPFVVWLYLSVIPALLYLPLPTTDLSSATADSIEMHTGSTDAQLHEKLLRAEVQASALRNRLQLAGGDSVYMVLNLSDSTLQLEIKGLVVHRAKASQLKLSKRIAAAGSEALLEWTASPFTLQNELASIPKSPILVVEAPKDTAAAASLPRKPLEPEKSAVFYTLIFDRSLVLEVNQQEKPEMEDAVALTSYQSAVDSSFRRSSLSRLKRSYSPEDPIHIKMQLPAADARAIYRAIPHVGHAKLVLSSI
jgi:hypothetical protein